eukprot:scaffold346_cov347-Pavlova_lutheri.AAC.10
MGLGRLLSTRNLPSVEYGQGRRAHVMGAVEARAGPLPGGGIDPQVDCPPHVPSVEIGARIEGYEPLGSNGQEWPTRSLQPRHLCCTV